MPGVYDVSGALSGGTVTVNGSSSGVTRHGEYFFKGHSLTNSSNAAYAQLTVSDGSTTFDLYAFLAKTAEVFTYDDDGNLKSDGKWDYDYDAENRLVSMQTHTALSPSPFPNAEARRLEFKYDYLGRRVRKTVYRGYNGSSFAITDSDEKFVWNGWLMIAKLNAASSNALVASHYWGLDLSGSTQGAGGVGGLLMTTEGGNAYLPLYDAMGNVHAMLKASDGSIAAGYEYDAFGRTLRESGTYAAANPFRFSTKYTDGETGLVYYGHRYYSPSLGRFINRDPIEEQGGLNLYAFCGNNPASRWDCLGHETIAADGGPGSDWTYRVVVAGGYASKFDLYGIGDAMDFREGRKEQQARDAAQAQDSAGERFQAQDGNWYRATVTLHDTLIQVADGSYVPLGTAAANGFAAIAPDSAATEQGNFTRVGTVVDRTEIGEVNPGGGRFLQWTDATKTVDSLGLYGQVTTVRAIGLYGTYTTYKVQWSGFYLDPVSGAVQIRPEAEFLERTLTSTTTRATMDKTYSHFLATHADANLSFAVRPEHQVGYTTIHGFRRLDDND